MWPQHWGFVDQVAKGSDLLAQVNSIDLCRTGKKAVAWSVADLRDELTLNTPQEYFLRLQLEKICAFLQTRFQGDPVLTADRPHLTPKLGQFPFDAIPLKAFAHLGRCHQLVAVFVPPPEVVVFCIGARAMRFLV